MNRKEEMLAALDALSVVVEDASSMSYERNPQDYSQFGEPSCYIDARKAIAALRASAAPEEGMEIQDASEIVFLDAAGGQHRIVYDICEDRPGLGSGWFLHEDDPFALPSDSGKAAPDAWRYKCQDGSVVLMLKRLTDEQKRRGYYTGEDGEDEVDGDEAVVGPFHWAEETPLYAALAPATEGGPAGTSFSEEETYALFLILDTLARIRKGKDKTVHYMRERTLPAYREWHKQNPFTARPAFAVPSAQREAPPPAWLGDEGGGP